MAPTERCGIAEPGLAEEPGCLAELGGLAELSGLTVSSDQS